MERRCDERGFHLYISNPSFEVWLLCHHRAPTHRYTPNEAVEELSAELGGYQKSRGFELDDEMVDKAIANARALLPDEECSAEGCYRRNPSTMVHSLVKTILRRMSDRRSLLPRTDLPITRRAS